MLSKTFQDLYPALLLDNSDKSKLGRNNVPSNNTSSLISTEPSKLFIKLEALYVKENIDGHIAINHIIFSELKISEGFGISMLDIIWGTK